MDFINFAVGWDSKDKPDQINCSADPTRTSIGKDKKVFKLKIENEFGEQMDVTNFFIKKLGKRQSQSGKPLPEYQFTVVVK